VGYDVHHAIIVTGFTHHFQEAYIAAHRIFNRLVQFQGR